MPDAAVPCNIEAEEALLGSLLIDGEAIEKMACVLAVRFRTRLWT
jgi:replicative DNA helicase